MKAKYEAEAKAKSEAEAKAKAEAEAKAKAEAEAKAKAVSKGKDTTANSGASASTAPVCDASRHWKENLSFVANRFLNNYICYSEWRNFIWYDPSNGDVNFNWGTVDWNKIPFDLHYRITETLKRDMRKSWWNGEYEMTWTENCVTVNEFTNLITNL